MLKKLFCIFSLSSVLTMPVSAVVLTGNFVFDTGNTGIIYSEDFETGLVNWTKINDGRGDILHSNSALSGSGSAVLMAMSSFSGAGYALQSENISVDVNAEYILSGYINTANMTTGQAYIDLSDASFEPNLGAEELSKSLNDWQFVYTQFTPTTDNIQIRLVNDGNVIAGESVLFDLIKVTKASDFIAPPNLSEVPVPAAAWLFISGLLGIMGMKRKL